MQYLLAHDLGTSGDKATLFTTDGALVRSTVASYPCHYGPGNWAEQDPEDWYAAVCQATRGLLELAAPEDVVGVSFSGHMMGSVLLDRHGALAAGPPRRAAAPGHHLGRPAGHGGAGPSFPADG